MSRYLWMAVIFIWLAAAGHANLNLLNEDLRSPQNQARVQAFQLQKSVSYGQTRAESVNYSPEISITPQGAPVQGPVQPSTASSPSNVYPYEATQPHLERQPTGIPVDILVSGDIARSILNFAHKLDQQLSTTYRKTEVFSPLSIMSALALLFVGAKGATYNELADVFGLNNAKLQNNPYKLHEQLSLLLRDVQQTNAASLAPERGVVPWRTNVRGFNVRFNRNHNKPIQHDVYVANAIFVQNGYSLNMDYKEVITSFYGAHMELLDFQTQPAQSRHKINEWVSENTKEKILDIITRDIDPSTRVIMASALYFKGFWEQDFIVEATKVDNFYPDGHAAAPIRVQMMATSGMFPYYADGQQNYRIIGLPYRGNLTTMYIIQPLQSSVAELHKLRYMLNADKIEDMIANMVKRSSVLTMPKLHVVESINMKEILAKLGIRSIFSRIESDLTLISSTSPSSVTGSNPNLKAPQSSRNAVDSLTNLESQRHARAQRTQSDLYVDDIAHKVDLVVNEQGTEAAAATVSYITKSGPEVVFRADAPFMLVIRHDPTKLILFYGVINEPEVAAEDDGVANGNK